MKLKKSRNKFRTAKLALKDIKRTWKISGTFNSIRESQDHFIFDIDKTKIKKR